jgi:hypothetical protein
VVAVDLQLCTSMCQGKQAERLYASMRQLKKDEKNSMEDSAEEVLQSKETSWDMRRHRYSFKCASVVYHRMQC